MDHDDPPKDRLGWLFPTMLGTLLFTGLAYAIYVLAVTDSFDAFIEWITQGGK